MKMQKLGRWGRFWLCMVLSVLVGTIITAAYVRNSIKLEESQMEQLTWDKANKVEHVLTNLLFKTQILATLVIQNDGNVEEFEKMAAAVVDDPAIRNVLVAPNGVVSHVYPLQGNEQVLGLDYYTDQTGNKEAALARENGELVLGGPFELVQGGMALVGRLPVYIEANQFWGIVSVTLNYPQALEGADLDQLRNQGFAFEIWRINPDTGERQVIANSEYNYNKKARYVEHDMNILNAQWYFRLSPIRAWYQFPETWILIGMTLLVSMLLSFLVVHNYDLILMKKELEQLSYCDALTGARNRRGAFWELERRSQESDHPFLLCFIDIDKFKRINDQFGHHIGDMVLEGFARGVEEHLSEKPHMLARIGGDEFLIMFEDLQDQQVAKELLKKIEKELLQEGYRLTGCQIPVTFSVGFAVYPEDGKTIDELVAVADQKMYCSKNTK